MGNEKYTDRAEFDINSSINTLRFTLEHPELKDAILNQELSYVEEGINAAQVRPYTLYFDGDQLYSELGVSMRDTLENGEQWAESDITKRKARADIIEYEKLVKLMKGEIDGDTLVSFRPFPKESANDENATELMRLGFQPIRQLGFMNIYKRGENGVLNVECISLDGTKPRYFRTIAVINDQNIPKGILSDEFQAYPLIFDSRKLDVKTEILNLYDALIAADNNGIPHKQGRPIVERSKSQIEIRSFIDKQPELKEWYYQNLVALAKSHLTGEQLKQKKIDLTYSFWASIKERYDNPTIYNAKDREIRFDLSNDLDFQRISREVSQAGLRAAERFEILIGCGGAMGMNINGLDGTTSLFDLSPEEAMKFIFSKQESDDFIPQKLRCINPKCKQVSDKSKVVKKDCWQCPKCGTKAICGRIEIPDLHKEKSGKNIVEGFFKKSDVTRNIAKTALK